LAALDKLKQVQTRPKMTVIQWEKDSCKKFKYTSRQLQVAARFKNMLDKSTKSDLWTEARSDNFGRVWPILTAFTKQNSGSSPEIFHGKNTNPINCQAFVVA